MSKLSASAKLTDQGSFVILYPGHAVLTSGEPWTVLVPSATCKRLRKSMVLRQQILDNLLLPGSLGGLRFLPDASSQAASQVMHRWQEAFHRLRDFLTEDAFTLLGAVTAERLAALFARRRQQCKAFLSSAEVLRDRLVSLGDTRMLFEPPSICPVDITCRSYPDLENLLGAFVQVSRATAFQRAVYALVGASKRAVLYNMCTDQVFSSRHYYAKHISCLPIDSWLSWFKVLGNKSVVKLMQGLLAHIPSRDPGRLESVRICELLHDAAHDLGSLGEETLDAIL